MTVACTSARASAARAFFAPGNRMHLQSGRLKDLIESNLEADSAPTCHETMWDDPDEKHALCRGFFERFGDQVFPIRLARAMDLVEYIDPPRKE